MLCASAQSVSQCRGLVRIRKRRVRFTTGMGYGGRMRVLLVEDSERLRELLSEALEIGGYMVDGVATVGELFSSVAAVNYDLLIVDLGLPDDEGLDAIRTLRSSGVSKPIIIITARGDIDDRVRGLDSGADDYLIKPFNHAELLARVRALLRRPYDFQGTVLRRGNTE